jgi:hypothetical protein
MAQKLNLGERRLEGEPTIVAGGENPGGSRIETFSVSETGVLVYRFGGPSLYQLAWHERDGRLSGTVGAPAAYLEVFLSPNEKLAAINKVSDGRLGLWLLHLDHEIPTQLSSEADAPIVDGFWSPDSRQLVYQVFTETKTRIMTMSLGDMTPKLVYEDAVRNWPDDWSPDGKWIIYRREGRAVYIISPDGKARRQLLPDAPYFMDQFQFSPDTQWLAYNSMKSGQWEVYVSRFPSMTDTRQVSTAGGCQPIWRKDGKELFYLTEDGKLMAIPITQGSNLETGAPKELFPTSIRVNCTNTQFAVAQNGEKFLLMEPARAADAAPSREPIHILDQLANRSCRIEPKTR